MIVLYGKDNCARCEQVKKLLEKRNIDFKYKSYEKEFPKHITLEDNVIFPIIVEEDNIKRLSDVLTK
jgi:arsenate reductase-like glutaredoxin family protein